MPLSKFDLLCCPDCGLKFYVPYTFEDLREADHAAFPGPCGHLMCFPESESEGDTLVPPHEEVAPVVEGDLLTHVKRYILDNPGMSARRVALACDVSRHRVRAAFKELETESYAETLR